MGGIWCRVPRRFLGTRGREFTLFYCYTKCSSIYYSSFPSLGHPTMGVKAKGGLGTGTGIAVVTTS